MADLYSLVDRLEEQIASKTKMRADAHKEIEALLDTEDSAERDERIDTLFEQIEASRSDEAKLESRLVKARKAIEEDEAADARSRETRETVSSPASRKTGEFTITNEKRTYNKHEDPTGRQFLSDVVARQLDGDPDASQRLSRHQHEEMVERGQKMQRAVGTSAFTGLVVPQYLLDMVAPAAHEMRPFADIANKHPLPADGMTVEISRITTASSVDVQATQNTAVDETNMDDTILSVPVRTVAGQQTISRQALDRGSGIESIVMDDLVRQYHTRLDNTMLNVATNGAHTVGVDVAYDDASPTGAELYPKIMQAAAGVEAALLTMGRPSHAVMHSRRWYWLSKEMTSTWPLINSLGIDPRAGGQLDPNSSYDNGIRGILPNGLKVIVDNNITITGGVGAEDEIMVVPASEVHLWEDPAAPVFIRAEQTNAASLGVLLVLYGYFAFTLERYANAIQRVNGTGLTTPSF